MSNQSWVVRGWVTMGAPDSWRSLYKFMTTPLVISTSLPTHSILLDTVNTVC